MTRNSILGFVPEANQNLSINGGFDVWQRGITFTSSTWRPNSDDNYLQDRWLLLSDGNNIVQVDRADSTFGNSRYCSKYTVVTANKKFGLMQILPASDVIPLRGKKVSLSFKARTTSGKVINNLRCAVLEWTSTADTVTSDVVSAWGAQGVNPTWATNWAALNTAANLALSTSNQTFKVENVTVGASANNLAVFIWCDDTDCATGDELYIGEIKHEIGAIATEYQYRDDLSKCNYRCKVITGAHWGGVGGTSLAVFCVGVDMAYSPSLSSVVGDAQVAGFGASPVNVASFSAESANWSNKSVGLLATTSSEIGGTGRGAMVYLKTGYIVLEAEL